MASGCFSRKPGGTSPTCARALQPRDARVQVRDFLADPALLQPLLQRRGVDFGDDADRAGDERRFALRARHAAQPRGDVDFAAQVVQVEVFATWEATRGPTARRS